MIKWKEVKSDEGDKLLWLGKDTINGEQVEFKLTVTSDSDFYKNQSESEALHTIWVHNERLGDRVVASIYNREFAVDVAKCFMKMFNDASRIIEKIY